MNNVVLAGKLELERLDRIADALEKIESHLEAIAVVAVHLGAPDDDPGELEQPQQEPDPSQCPKCGFPDNVELKTAELQAEYPGEKRYVCAQCGHVWKNVDAG